MTAPSLNLTRRNIVGSLFALVSGKSISQGIVALTLLLTARHLGAGQFGQYASTTALMGLLMILVGLGLDSWLLREGAADRTQLPRQVGSVLVVKGVGGAILFAAMSFIAPWLNPDSFPPDLIRLSTLVVWFDGLFNTLLTAYKASLRSGIPSTLEPITDVVWLLATLGLIGAGRQDVQLFMLVRWLALILSVLVATLLARRHIGLQISLSAVRQSLRAAPAFAVSDFLAWTVFQVDVAIIGLTLGKSAAGLYAPAVNVANALLFVTASISGVMLPVLSGLYFSDQLRAWRAARRSLMLSGVAGVGLSLGLFLGAGHLVSLLGASYAESRELMQILSVVLLFKSLSSAAATILVAFGWQTQRTAVQAIAVASNIGLNLLAVYWVGIAGVAVVYILTEIISLAGYAFLLQRNRHQQPVTT